MNDSHLRKIRISKILWPQELERTVVECATYSEKQMALERRRNADNQQRQMQTQAQQLFRRGVRDDGTSLITSSTNAALFVFFFVSLTLFASLSECCVNEYLYFQAPAHWKRFWSY